MTHPLTTFELQASITDPRMDVEHIGRYRLCFLLGEHSCDVAIMEDRDARCLLFEHYTAPANAEISIEERVDMLNHMVKNHHFMQAGYWKRVIFLYRPASYAFVPTPFFDEEHAGTYLELNAPIPKGSVLHYKPLGESNITAVCTISTQLTAWLKECYPRVSVHPVPVTASFVTLLLKMGNTKAKELHVNVRDSVLDVCVVEESTLLFANSFSFKNKEDVVYYMLSTADSLAMQRGEVEVHFYGQIAEGAHVMGLLRRYFKSVELGKVPAQFNLDPRFTELDLYRYLDLFSAVYQ